MANMPAQEVPHRDAAIRQTQEALGRAVFERAVRKAASLDPEQAPQQAIAAITQLLDDGGSVE